jgi:hypothetical protein
LPSHLHLELSFLRKLPIDLSSGASAVKVLLFDGVKDRTKFSWTSEQYQKLLARVATCASHLASMRQLPLLGSYT